MLLTVEGNAALVKEVERRIRVTDGVIKFITVRVDEELRKAERRKARRTAEEAKRRAKATGRGRPDRLSRRRWSCELRWWRRRWRHGRRRRGGPGGGRGGRPAPRAGRTQGKRYFFRRRKVCKFCADKIDYVDYKDVKLLSSFVPERGKVLPRRMFGTCAEHQRKLTLAIKRARNIALLPFASE